MAQHLNKTHIEHALIAVFIQFLIWPFLGALAGGCFAAAVFLGREIAQHEYKLATSRGWVYGQPLPVKWHEGVTTGWSTDSVLDVLFPFMACTAFPFLLTRFDMASF